MPDSGFWVVTEQRPTWPCGTTIASPMQTRRPTRAVLGVWFEPFEAEVHPEAPPVHAFDAELGGQGVQ